MATFYQPKNTQGVYEAAGHRLTVNQYDRVLIGFRASGVKELADTTVDASEDVIKARYEHGPTAVELEIDTDKPQRFFLTATQGVSMSATPKNMTPPLEVVVRKADYLLAPAVGQGRDPTACWAACLSYYLSTAPGRQSRSFVNVLGDFNGLWDATGMIQVTPLQRQITRQRPRYRMTAQRIVPSTLSQFLGRWPLVIAFHHPGGFGHMNVLTGSGDQLIRAMDPFFPDPPPNSITIEQGQLVLDSSAGDFQFNGGFIYRPPAYFQKPLGGGVILIGYPEEYGNRLS